MPKFHIENGKEKKKQEYREKVGKKTVEEGNHCFLV